MNQTDQLRAAARAYIVPLNTPRDGAGTHRFAVYFDGGIGSELRPLWPSDSNLGKRSAELIRHQVYSARKSYPAFHFACGGYGYCKAGEIARALVEINPALAGRVLVLGGHAPYSPE